MIESSRIVSLLERDMELTRRWIESIPANERTPLQNKLIQDAEAYANKDVD